jgi:hypothetical protein
LPHEHYAGILQKVVWWRLEMFKKFGKVVEDVIRVIKVAKGLTL